MSERPAPAFNLDEFRDQVARMLAEGSLRESIGWHPGLEELWASKEDPEAEVKRILAILDAMAPEERRDLRSVDRQARLRIAEDAGEKPGRVSALVGCMTRLVVCAEKRAMDSRLALIFLFTFLELLRRPKFVADPPDPVAQARHRALVRQLVGPARYDRTLAPWVDLGDRDLRLWDFTLKD